MSDEIRKNLAGLLDEMESTTAEHRELNTSNYGHDDVCQLNNWAIGACELMERVVLAARAQAAELEGCEAHLSYAEERADSAGRNASAFEDRMGNLQVENGRLRAELETLRQAAPMAVPEGLRERCKELIEWQKTGVLVGSALRSYAKAKWYAEEHNSLQMAEADTAREAYALITAAPSAPAPAAQEPVAVEVMRFQLKHPSSGETHTVEFTRAEVADGMEDVLYEKLSTMVCQCDGHDDCECADYIYDFDLIAAPPAAEQTDTVPAPRALQADDRVPDDFRNQASGYRAGWNDCLAALLGKESV